MAKSTLSDLQTEREQLRANEAKENYELLLKKTCSRDSLLTSAMQTRSSMLNMTNHMLTNLLSAIDGKFDETECHYQMTDCMLTLMQELMKTVDQTTNTLPEFTEYFKRGAKPRDLLTVSQWADRNRWLESGTNLPGKWKTSAAPYLKSIMDDLSEHSAVRHVTFIKSSGVGGTEAMYNFIGYVMHHLQNKDLLLVVPTLELRERSLNPRLSKMIDETPVLNEMVSKASRSKVNRGDLLEYGARARIIKAGANSPDSLRSDHLPYVICDEVDAFPWDVGGEGDPMTLIENRQRTFSRAKSYFVSTPTNDQASRIEILYKRSDQRRYYVPCPHCGEYQTLKFGGKNEPYGLKWRTQTSDDGSIEVTQAQYLCEHCAVLIDEGYKTEMLAQGRWVAGKPSVKHHHGYHINALYAPTGLGLNWKAIAEKWLQSQNDTSELKAFINTYLGEVFKEEGEEIEAEPLMLRLEQYNNPDIKIKTAGVDVQKDRLEITIDGWGAGEECWTLDHIILPGDTAQPEVWDDLLDTLIDSGIKRAAIDSGYNTSMVYSFCQKHAWAIPVKGMEGSGRPLVEDEQRRRQRLRRKRKRGMPVEPLGVDQGKAILYSRLKLTTKGAGYIHFPQDVAFDAEYFAQLTAEKLVTKIRGTRPISQWVKTRPRNEALDCKVYSLAALRLCNVDLTKYMPPVEAKEKDTETKNKLPASPKLPPAKRRMRVRQK